jgi:recombination protein RecA
MVVQKKELTPQEEIALIQKKLGHAVSKEKAVKYWLDMGEPLLHTALGSPTHGLPYGKVISLTGFESHGKTAVALEIAAAAQKDGADVAWVDPEDSFDEKWVGKRGLDPAKVALFKTELIEIKNKKGEVTDMRLKTAQELCAEAEEWVKLKHRQRPDGRIFVGVDSVTAFLVEDEEVAGIENQNMRTKTSLAQFMGQLLRRWTGIAAASNAMFLLINQVRIAPGVRFGDPEYSPGGHALLFYASSIARVRRAGGGRILEGDARVGMQGVITNRKNKVGEGSQEGHKVGFKVWWNKPGMQFLDAKKIQKEEAV